MTVRLLTKAIISVTVLFISFQIGRVYGIEKTEYIEVPVEAPRYIYIEVPSETTDAADEPEEPKPELKSYKGITEGDIITGNITHYCVCLECCGKTDGVTASGMKIQNGVKPDIPVVACNWLPFGTMVRMGGIEYIVADRGGRDFNNIGRLDVFVPEGHQAAFDLGVINDVEIEIISFK